jgi:hypothetical protein
VRQHYRLAMRRRPVCLHPGRFAPLDGGGVQYMFRGDQPLPAHAAIALLLQLIGDGSDQQIATDPERRSNVMQLAPGNP